MPSALFFFLKIASTICGPSSWFPTYFGTICSISVKNSTRSVLMTLKIHYFKGGKLEGGKKSKLQYTME